MPSTPTTVDAAVRPSASQALAGAISRDLRSPLHSLLGFLELLGMSGLSGEQQRTFDYLMADADTLARAADRLLLLCRLLGGARPAPVQSFDVAELLGGVAADSSTEVRIRLDRSVPDTLVGDVVNLRLMLAELLDNALRHGGGQVSLVVEPAGPAEAGGMPLRFSVTDSGRGLPGSARAFLDAPLDTAPEHEQGIGLYLVKQVAALLAGSISVRADAGTPASVAVTLRLLPSTGEAKPDATESAPEPNVLELPVRAVDPPATREPGDTTLRVLLIEDNAVNMLLTERQMKVLGHRLQTANRGRAGVQAALDGDFDVILMDRHLPDIDGVEATTQIRQVELASGRRRTPIIAVTADAMPRNREECFAAGMDGFLTKPLDLDELRTTLAGVLPAEEIPAAPTDAVDASTLRALADQLGAPDVIAELTHAYLAELPVRRLRLQSAVRRSSADGIIRAAEALRTPSETVGAVRLVALCQDMIDAARSGDPRAAHEVFPALREACEATAAALGSLPARLADGRSA